MHSKNFLYRMNTLFPPAYLCVHSYCGVCVIWGNNDIRLWKKYMSIELHNMAMLLICAKKTVEVLCLVLWFQMSKRCYLRNHSTSSLSASQTYSCSCFWQRPACSDSDCDFFSLPSLVLALFFENCSFVIGQLRIFELMNIVRCP